MGGNEEHRIFNTITGPLRLYDFKNNVQAAITYELDRDLRIVRRKVYGILDFLGDIGGLAGALKALFAASIIIFQYKAAIHYAANRLYMVDKSELEKEKTPRVEDFGSSQSKELERIEVGFWASIKHSFQRLFSFLCCKCCFSRKDRLVHAADEKMKDELKIVRWIKFMRTADHALKQIFTKQQWKEIEKAAKYRKITLDGDSDNEPSTSN